MPIYMDRHDIQGVTAEQVAAIHQEDLKIEQKYGCRVLTYWFDKKRGTAFCLIEAPKKDAVVKLHDEAHGQVPTRIIEVENRLVEMFLGRIQDPESVFLPGPDDFPVIDDPAFRIVMVLQIKNAANITGKLGLQQALEHFRELHSLVNEHILQHNGRITDHFGHGVMATFASPEQTVDCAAGLTDKIKEFNSRSAVHPVQLATGLAAGEPVTENNSLFGETIQLADRLCLTDTKEEVRINVSPAVYDLYMKSKSERITRNKQMKLFRPEEEIFLNRLMDVIDNNWDRESFNVADLGRQMGMSKSQLYRNITSVTGISPGEFIRKFRLDQAINMIERQSDNIAQIAYASGFGNPSWFAKCFRQYVGVLPSEYAKTFSANS